MKAIKQAILITCLSIIINRCGMNPVDIASENNPSSSNTEIIIRNNNSFSFKLFNQLSSMEGDTNIFISPMSVSMALGMVYNGAHGDTKEAMEYTLGLSALTKGEINRSYKSIIELLTGIDPEVTLDIANSIWYRSGFYVENDFIDLTKKYFYAEIYDIDFNDPFSADTINAWVYDKTNGKISRIIDKQIDDTIMMFLLNAIYFAGSWASPFEKAALDSVKFYKYDNTSVTCRMMLKKGCFNYYSNDIFSSVDLPYGDSCFSMTLFLPKDGIGIDSLIREFNRRDCKSWIDKLEPEWCDIQLPKFKIEYSKSLKDVLISLGMEIAFSRNADFSGINKDGGLLLSDVRQKAFIDVDEEGTVAAVTTIISVIIGSNPDTITPIKTIFFNRPFLFIIRENTTQSILFIGKIMEPKYD